MMRLKISSLLIIFIILLGTAKPQVNQIAVAS